MALATLAWPPPVDSERVRGISVAAYHHLIECGEIGADDAIELLEGWMVDKMPKGSLHDYSLGCTQDRVTPMLPFEWIAFNQSALTTDESEPEPDFMIVRGPRSRYLKRHPKPEEVGMTLEVSDSSLSRDREKKGRIFARAGIENYWIINLIENVIERYSQPGIGNDGLPAYLKRDDFARGTNIPLILDGQTIGEIAVADLLPSDADKQTT